MEEITERMPDKLYFVHCCYLHVVTCFKHCSNMAILYFLLQTQYFVLLLFIFLLEVLAGVLAYVYYQQVCVCV